jgi:hypothetical protein
MADLDVNQEFTGQYFNALRESLKAGEDAISRALFLLLLLAFVFVMITHGGISDINLGITHLSNVETIRPFIPLVFAYIYGTVSNCGISIMRLSDELTLALKDIKREKRESAFIPPNSLFSFHAYMISVSELPGLPRYQTPLLVVFMFVRVGVIVLAPVGFIIYSIWEIIPTDNPFSILSVALTIFLVVSNLAVSIFYFRTYISGTW